MNEIAAPSAFSKHRTSKWKNHFRSRSKWKEQRYSKPAYHGCRGFSALLRKNAFSTPGISKHANVSWELVKHSVSTDWTTQRGHVKSHEEAASGLLYLISFSKSWHSSTCNPGRKIQRCFLLKAVITFIWRRYVLRLNLWYWKQAERLKNWQSASLWFFALSQLCIPFSVWLLSWCSEKKILKCINEWIFCKKLWPGWVSDEPYSPLSHTGALHITSTLHYVGIVGADGKLTGKISGVQGSSWIM